MNWKGQLSNMTRRKKIVSGINILVLVSLYNLEFCVSPLGPYFFPANLKLVQLNMFKVLPVRMLRNQVIRVRSLVRTSSQFK